jgi:hypothetical protein
MRRTGIKMQQRGSKKTTIFVALLALCIAGLAGWLFTQHYLSRPVKTDKLPDKPLIEQKDAVSKNQEGIKGSRTDGDNITVSVKIFYPSEEGISTVEKSVQSSHLHLKMAEAVIAEYLKGLKEGMKDTKLLGIYKDRNNVLYIDLSDEIRKNFSGDVKHEYFFLKSLFQTVVTNIPEIEDIKLFVEGKEIQSIGGHFYTLYPLKDMVTD